MDPSTLQSCCMKKFGMVPSCREISVSICILWCILDTGKVYEQLLYMLARKSLLISGTKSSPFSALKLYMHAVKNY